MEDLFENKAQLFSFLLQKRKGLINKKGKRREKYTYLVTKIL